MLVPAFDHPVSAVHQMVSPRSRESQCSADTRQAWTAADAPAKHALWSTGRARRVVEDRWIAGSDLRRCDIGSALLRCLEGQPSSWRSAHGDSNGQSVGLVELACLAGRCDHGSGRRVLDAIGEVLTL